MAHQRKSYFATVLAIIFALISIFITLCGCNDQSLIYNIKVHSGASVNFLDVGQGDCIFIRLPDGKNVLIDTGEKDIYNKKAEYVIDFFEKYSVNAIDYLILTHPDSDHTGNATKLINRFSVINAFVPFVRESILSLYPEFKSAINALNLNGANVKISDCYQNVVGDGYAMIFLSPMQKDDVNSSYFHFNGMQIPDESASNNLSPIIYLDLLGTRFIFTGDAGKSQERQVLQNYYSHFYNQTTLGLDKRVSLENVDYLKVGHHGADTSSCEDFLSVLSPKNAIISVGGNNFYGHPKTEVLYRILDSNQDCNIYRTDVHGTIYVHQNSTDSFVVSSQLD